MKRQNNQGNENSSIFQDIHGEVSAENAPLLRFFEKYAGVIAGITLAILLVIAAVAVWNWYNNGKQKEAQDELARINMELKGANRDAALAKLAENAPDNVKLFVYMSLGQSAQENGNPVLAAEAYAKAAKLDGDGALGLAAALGSAGSLLMQQEFVQALALLQELDAKYPEAHKSQQFRQMLAEAAAKAGKPELAISTYNALANEVKTPEAAYYRARAEAIAAGMKKDDAGKQVEGTR